MESWAVLRSAVRASARRQAGVWLWGMQMGTATWMLSWGIPGMSRTSYG